MTDKDDPLHSLFADALKAVEKIETDKTETQQSPNTEASGLDLDFEIEIEESSQEDRDDEEISVEITLTETEDFNQAEQYQKQLEEAHTQYAELEEKFKRSLRGLKKYKREQERSQKQIEILQKELGQLRLSNQQKQRKLEMLESRSETSREALVVANKRIDELTEAISMQENQIARTKTLRRKEAEQQKRFGAAPAITRILPSIDSLEMALDHSQTNPEALQEGLRVALNQFQASLESIGVKKIDSNKGSPFNPAYHEAVMRIPSNEVANNHILECFCTAYELNGRLLRAAKVSVATTPPNETKK